jgi:hypothetical protein
LLYYQFFLYIIYSHKM